MAVFSKEVENIYGKVTEASIISRIPFLEAIMFPSDHLEAAVRRRGIYKVQQADMAHNLRMQNLGWFSTPEVEPWYRLPSEGSSVRIESTIYKFFGHKIPLIESRRLVI